MTEVSKPANPFGPLFNAPQRTTLGDGVAQGLDFFRNTWGRPSASSTPAAAQTVAESLAQGELFPAAGAANGPVVDAAQAAALDLPVLDVRPDVVVDPVAAAPLEAPAQRGGSLLEQLFPVAFEPRSSTTPDGAPARGSRLMGNGGGSPLHGLANVKFGASSSSAASVADLAVPAADDVAKRGLGFFARFVR